MPPNRQRTARIELHKDYLHFSAAHFTIFSSTERENLHGHNFFVEATVEGPVGDDGLCFDYNEVKNRLKALCDRLDETVLLPEDSPHLAIERDGGHTFAVFGSERIPFLDRDATSLPVRNVTVEELAHWFLDRLTEDTGLTALAIERMEVKVSSGPGQWAAAQWDRPPPSA